MLNQRTGWNTADDSRMPSRTRLLTATLDEMSPMKYGSPVSKATAAPELVAVPAPPVPAPRLDTTSAFSIPGEVTPALAGQVLAGEHGGARHPVFPLHRQALRDRRAPWQHAAEIHIVPVRGKMDPVVAVAVAIDLTGQRGERQIETVERMGEQQRVAFRRLDSP